MKNILFGLCLLLCFTSCETYGQVQEQYATTFNVVAFFDQSLKAQQVDLQNQRTDLIEELNKLLSAQTIEDQEYIEQLNAQNEIIEAQLKRISTDQALIHRMQAVAINPIPLPPPPVPCPRAICDFRLGKFDQVIFPSGNSNYLVKISDSQTGQLLRESGQLTKDVLSGGRITPLMVKGEQAGEFVNISLTEMTKAGKVIQTVSIVARVD